ncbi:MAG: hypothetical protein WBB85_04820 [Albidovulum sp.]|uniref:hypothetical protein n=1 Tax=Albidovulum sp. TaxID=1872424 RepID=UPI003CA68732
MTTLLTNARLIDPEAGTDTLGAVLVEDGVDGTCRHRGPRPTGAGAGTAPAWGRADAVRSASGPEVRV